MGQLHHFGPLPFLSRSPNWRISAGRQAPVSSTHCACASSPCVACWRARIVSHERASAPSAPSPFADTCSWGLGCQPTALGKVVFLPAVSGVAPFTQPRFMGSPAQPHACSNHPRVACRIRDLLCRNPRVSLNPSQPHTVRINRTPPHRRPRKRTPPIAQPTEPGATRSSFSGCINIGPHPLSVLDSSALCSLFRTSSLPSPTSPPYPSLARIPASLVADGLPLLPLGGITVRLAHRRGRLCDAMRYPWKVNIETRVSHSGMRCRHIGTATRAPTSAMGGSPAHTTTIGGLPTRRGQLWSEEFITDMRHCRQTALCRGQRRSGIDVW
jgi:hypothetical protein